MKHNESATKSTPPVSSQSPEEIREISLIDITVPKHRARRLRDVTSLVESIAQSGLIEPIVVRRLSDGRLVLVCGAHRLEAHRQLGRATILARIIEVSDLEAELIELDENLERTALTVLERGEYLLRRKEIYEQLHPETKHGGAPGKKGGGKEAKGATVASFAEDTAAKTGLSVRTILETVVDLYRRLLDAKSRFSKRHGAFLDGSTTYAEYMEPYRGDPESERVAREVLGRDLLALVRELNSFSIEVPDWMRGPRLRRVNGAGGKVPAPRGPSRAGRSDVRCAVSG